MFLRLLVLVSVLAASSCGRGQQTSAPETPRANWAQPKIVVGLREIPNLKLRPRAAANPAETAEIKGLIAGLARIDKPDFGLSSTMSGDAFLPIKGMSQAGAFVFTNHNLQSSPELKELVERGPEALPILLAALDDQTPTRLIMTHYGAFGGMWFANELTGNPNNSLEAKVLPNRTESAAFPSEENVTEYVVKVGDVCLVAIGQIVGRSYQAVRYQPTACIVLNSPTHDAELCRQVRAIWTSPDARQKLFDSLLLDSATEGGLKGDELQTNAVMRLLYYFPQESAVMLAERIDRLQAAATGPGAGSRHTDTEMKLWMKQNLANGVGADDFVKAVAWSREPAVRQALFRLFQRSSNIDITLNSLPAVAPDHAKTVRDRLTRMLDELPEETGGPFGDGYHLLIALGKYGDEGSIETFRKYLRPKTVLRCRALSHALRETRKDWAVDLLAPLLSDRRDTDGWTYAVKPDENEPRLSIRICDEAAETISMRDPHLKFEMHGTHEELDRQIDAIRRKIETRRK